MRWVLALSIPLVLAGLPEAAFADEGASDVAGAAAKATAEDLYQQGLALTQQQKWAEAAVKLEESNRLDPAPGTLVNLADCYEHLGRFASAWTSFVEAATIFSRRTPPDPRGETAKARAEALYPKLSRLTIDVPKEVRAPGLVVKRDGQEVGEAQFGTALAVDAGPHEIEVSAPGKATWKKKMEVGQNAAKEVLVVPPLANAPKGATEIPEQGFPWQKKAALGVGGVGVAGVIVGGIFGGLALGNHDALAKHCDAGTPRKCDAEGLSLANDQKTVAMVSTIGFAAGGALVAAGVVLWLVAPSGSPANAGAGAVWIAPLVGPQTGLSVGMVW